MVRNADERNIIRDEHKFGGEGYVMMANMINGPDELNGKGRVFSHVKVPPHSSIGYHVHNGDTEIYYVLKGNAAYCDNGSWCRVKEGDVAFTRSGEGHAVYNDTDEPFEVIALIIYS